jgi:hypothetical protein
MLRKKRDSDRYIWLKKLLKETLLFMVGFWRGGAVAG